jgi:hypothetical protein
VSDRPIGHAAGTTGTDFRSVGGPPPPRLDVVQPDKRRRRTTYSAPIGSVDLAAFDEDGEPYEIHGCHYCLPWYAEVHIGDDGEVFVREWHAVECEAFEELINGGGDSQR